MLVLTRKVGQKIHVGDDVILTIVRIQNDKVRIGIEAPRDVSVHREEVIRREPQAAPAVVPRPAPR